MKWNKGHVWTLEEPICINESVFGYKYVILEKGKPATWEKGVNRIADLKLLKPSESSSFTGQKMVEINDKWQ